VSDYNFQLKLLEEAEQRLASRCSSLTKTASNRLERLFTKEAAERLEKTKSLTFPHILLREAENRLNTILQKYAMDIEYMTGGKDLRNSSSNVRWSMEDPTPRIAEIKADIQSIFADYANRVIGGRQYAIPTGMRLLDPPPFTPVLEDEDLQKSKEQGVSFKTSAEPARAGEEDTPTSTIYFRFQYKRMIMPINDKEAMTRSTMMLEGLNAICPGIADFVKDLEQNNITLQPYFNNSLGLQSTADEIRSFIENDRTIADGILPQGQYKNYATVINDENFKITPTRAYGSRRIYTNDQIPDVQTQGQLLNAIARKAMDGYTLNVEALQDEIEREKREALGRAKPTEQKGVADFWDTRFRKIVTAWEEGNKAVPLQHLLDLYEKRNQEEEKQFHLEHGENAQYISRYVFNANYVAFDNPADFYFFVDKNYLRRKQQEQKKKNPSAPALALNPHKIMIRPLLNTVRVKKSYQAKDLLREEVELILKYLIVKGNKPVGRGRPRAEQQARKQQNRDDIFSVRMFTIYKNNGLDSTPQTREKEDGPGISDQQAASEATEAMGHRPMLVLPTMRKLPNGELTYDRDSGNMGRYQLVENWTTPSDPMSGSGGLKSILHKWGPQCKNSWLRNLQMADTIGTVFDTIKRVGADPEKSKFVDNLIRFAIPKALEISIHSRTNAENVLLMLSKYADFASFKKNHLDKTMASEVNTITTLNEANILPDIKAIFMDMSDSVGQQIPMQQIEQQIKLLKGKNPERVSQAAEWLVDILKQAAKAEMKELVSYLRNITERISDFKAANPNEDIDYNNPQQVGQRSTEIQQLEFEQGQLLTQSEELNKKYGEKILQLMAIFNDNIRDWDTLTSSLASCSTITDALGKPIKPCTVDSKGKAEPFPSVVAKTDSPTAMNSEQDYALLKEYGYAIAKMMDFISAIMNISCKEVLRNRADGRDEILFGRNYSSSSSKGGGGEVLLSVYYAFRPQWTDIQGVNEDLRKKLKDRARARHAKVGPAQPTGGQLLPSTQFATSLQEAELTEPQLHAYINNLGGVFRIAKDVKFFIGIRAGRQGGGFRKDMFKTMMPKVSGWDYSFSKALETFKHNYGDALGSLNAIIEPMNINIRRLDTAMKSAWEDVRNMLEKQLNMPIEATYTEEGQADEAWIGDNEKAHEDEMTQKVGSSIQVIPATEADRIRQETDIPEPEEEDQYAPEEAEEEAPLPQTPVEPVAPTTPIAPVAPVAPLPPVAPEAAPIDQTQQPAEQGERLVQKEEEKKPLLRNIKEPRRLKNNQMTASLADRLSKIADSLDRNGFTVVADKVDILLNIIKREKNVL
jgi:hypothetical protein